VARSGRLVATAHAPYADSPGCAEQSPSDWLLAAGDAATHCLAQLPPVRACVARKCTRRAFARRFSLTVFFPARAQGASVHAVALCGQMQTLTLVGSAPGALARRTALLYSDCRATEQAAAIDAALAAAPALRSSNLAGAGGASVPAKLLWLQRHEPDALRRTRAALLGAHSALAWALTGGAALCADATSASASGVLAPADSPSSASRSGGPAYASAALERLGVDAGKLPPLLRPDAPAGVVAVCAGRLSCCYSGGDEEGSEDTASLFSFPASLAGVPLFHGAGDVAATAAGAGGGAHLYLGTSGWAARVCSTPDDEGERRRARPRHPGVFQLAAPTPGRVIRAAAAATAGGAVEWARTAFFGALPSFALSRPFIIPSSDGHKTLTCASPLSRPWRRRRACE